MKVSGQLHFPATSSQGGWSPVLMNAKLLELQIRGGSLHNTNYLVLAWNQATIPRSSGSLPSHHTDWATYNRYKDKRLIPFQEHIFWKNKYFLFVSSRLQAEGTMMCNAATSKFNFSQLLPQCHLQVHMLQTKRAGSHIVWQPFLLYFFRLVRLYQVARAVFPRLVRLYQLGRSVFPRLVRMYQLGRAVFPRLDILCTR